MSLPPLARRAVEALPTGGGLFLAVLLGLLGTAGASSGPAECGAPADFIHEVQGSGQRSPLVRGVVTVEGVVIGDFQSGAAGESGDLGGFYLQEEDHDRDGDSRTSEGIFVRLAERGVEEGDLLRVTGRVAESRGRTEISQVQAVVGCRSDVTLPSATEVILPVDETAYLESLENMLVTFPQQLYIAEYFNYDRYGEIVLTAPIPGTGRPYQPTSYLDPSDRATIAAELDLIGRSRITLDDGRSEENPSSSRHPSGAVFTLQNAFRGGDVVFDVTGVLEQLDDLYRVQPTLPAGYRAENPRPASPPDVGGSVRVATFNVLNYFEDFGRTGCGPEGFEECRGADDAAEFRRQRDKIVAALTVMDAHVVGLIEIENDADQGAIQDLVDALNEVAGSGTYAHVETGGPVGPDAIRVALVYQPGAVVPVGAPALFDTLAFLDPNGTGEDRNRAALSQTFEESGGGGRFTVVVNHLKSKGSACEVPGDDDALQGNCNETRRLAARALIDWLANDPTGTGDPDYLVLGDFNAYDREDPVRELRSGRDGALGTSDDYVDLLRAFQGEFAYTFVFDGMLGYLDNAFASPELASQVTGAAVWHINADEPDLINYDTTFKPPGQASLYAPDPYRSSDHDPVLVGIELER